MGMITTLQPNEVFVFGSNLAGIHGAGAAKQAAKWGAKWGVGCGHRGQTYALPTKDQRIKTLPLAVIAVHVKTFLRYATQNPQLNFLLTPIGCGLAGYSPDDIAPMFANAPSNVVVPDEFREVLTRF